ncbi:MAG: hydantoinase/oxoprolinase family protein [Pseudomonadales bacterium]|nr:hydantoinase/oxoprolinase family protein [Pseudomonadales bacterium]
MMQSQSDCNRKTKILGVDTGGTFTDFVLFTGDGVVLHKVLSTPRNPAQAIVQGISELGLDSAIKAGQVLVVHGTTVATNAALEKKGCRTVYIANKGLADVLAIGRQTRAELYNLTPVKEPPVIEPENCLEVDCRVSAKGERLVALDEVKIAALVEQIDALKPDAVAINLLFSFLDEQDEKALEAALTDRYFVSRSSFVLPQYGEYERGMATWLNAWLGPKVEQYLGFLAQALQPARISIMQSSGGTIALEQASQRAVNLLLSGPAGGLSAVAYLSGKLAEPRMMTFDMGGTSTDVALVDEGIRITHEGHLGPYPVAVPMVDMHTIGAGGGSLAWIDAGGMLQVGPESAGADPGPACYGKGGTQATVTDANVVLGRLRPENFLGGSMSLDEEASRLAVQAISERLGVSVLEAAEGIVRLANEHMVKALRSISVQRGYNPKDFVLCSFGGAGGLHVCALADALSMTRAIVPLNSGVLSAFGMVVAPKERRLTRTVNMIIGRDSLAELAHTFRELQDVAEQELLHEGVTQSELTVTYSVALRYQGQTFTLELPADERQYGEMEPAFHEAHKLRYGYQMNRPVEIVNVSVRVFASVMTESLSLTPQPAALRASGGSQAGHTESIKREHMNIGQIYSGPLLIIDSHATLYVDPKWQARCDEMGNVLLEHP